MKLLIETLEQRQLLSADLTGVFVSKVPTALPLQATNHLTVRITNQGDAVAAGPANVLLYASTDPTLDSGDTLLATTPVKFNLKTAKSSNVGLKFASPTTLSTGAYFLLAEIVDSPAIIEQNTANNVFATPTAVTITAPFIDLTDTITLSPKTTSYIVGAKKQTPLKFTVVVTNNGNVPAKEPLGLNLFGSLNQTLDARDTLLLSLPTKPVNIKAGKTKLYTLSFKPTTANTSGTFYAIAQIAANGNSSASSNPFTISNPALPIAPKLVDGLTVNITQVAVGMPELVTFSATVAEQTPSTMIEVDEVDAAGNPISKIADLFDNGVTTNGDAVAGDGIFSGIISISFDAPGVRYFVATLTDPTTQSTGHTAATTITGF